MDSGDFLFLSRYILLLLFRLVVPPLQKVIGADAVLATQLRSRELAGFQHPVHYKPG